MTITASRPASRIIEQPPFGTWPFAGLVPTGFGAGMTSANMIFNVASAADNITPWGVDPRQRDAQLRAFWPTEPYFSSGLFTIMSKYVAFGYSFEGPPKSVTLAQNLMNRVEFGKGPETFFMKVLTDYFTQDNGAFIEIVRAEDDPGSPVLTLNHLDSGRCIRTGHWERPVLYIDLKGRYHELKYYQVLDLVEMPSPIEEARGVGHSALSRILRAVQIMRDVLIVKQEKAGGRFTRQVHFVSGVHTRAITEAMNINQAAADAAGLLKFVKPVIMGGLDPNAKVGVETIDLASIPDDYDEQKAMQTYITLLALAFGSDYQDFAPLPGGGLGSGSQSKVMNMKSRGKGPALWMRVVERLFNFQGLIPGTVRLKFGEQDAAQQMEDIEVRKSGAEELKILIDAGLITTQVGRQILVDRGHMAPDYLEMMGEPNATDEIDVPAGTPAKFLEPGDVEKGEPAPKEAPSNKAPENSNWKRPRNPETNQKRNPGATPEGGARA